MTFPAFHYNPQQEAPFTLFIEHRDKTRDGHWRPATFVMLTSSLRTSGFLWALPPEDLKSFLLLLTFVTPNGNIAPSVPQLATALRLSEAKTRERLARLVATHWHEQPIVLPHRMGNGLDTFSLAPRFLPVREEEIGAYPAKIQTPYKAAPREVIIEHSRRMYGRPRAEVERMIMEQMGYKKPVEAGLATSATSPQSPRDDADTALRDELRQVGLLPDQVNELLARFDTVRIRRQLMWLPYRPARNRAGLLLAAIKDDYEAPPNMRRSKRGQDEPDPITVSPDES